MSETVATHYDAVKDEPLHVYATGANRSDRAGKGRFDLIPPIALLRVAKHYENGAAVHGDRNWEKGFPFSRAVDSLERHLCQFKDGDAAEDHLAAIVWQVFAVMHFQAMIDRGVLPAELNDMPDYRPQAASPIPKEPPAIDVVMDNRLQ